MRPNAPGTQGYNLYAYVANNPTTWVDPTGHVAAVVPVPVAPRPWPVPENLLPYIVAAGAAGGLGLLGGQIAAAFELLVVVFDHTLREIYAVIQEATRAARCIAEWTSAAERCHDWANEEDGLAGWRRYKCCVDLANDRLSNCKNGHSHPRMPWESGYDYRCG